MVNARMHKTRASHFPHSNRTKEIHGNLCSELLQGKGSFHPLFAVNSADDEVNPPELGIMEQEIKKVAKGRYILLPITDQTSGHGTHSNPTIWGNYLKELLDISAK